MIHGIHHFTLHARDFVKMLTFYREAFGFIPAGPELQWEESEGIDNLVGLKNSAGRIAVLKAGTCFLELFEYAAPHARSGKPLGLQDVGYTHFGVVVSNIAEEYDRLKTLGMTFDSPHPIDLGDGKAVFGRDPEGNMIEIIEQTGRSTSSSLDALSRAPTRP